MEEGGKQSSGQDKEKNDQGAEAGSDESREIKEEIKAIPEGNPKVAEGRIRAINRKISFLQDDEKTRLKLEYILNEVAERGLDKDLKPLLDKSGLTLDVGLNLVLNHLTDKLSLARYLYKTPEEKLSEKGLKVIGEKLGPKLEVLGGLEAKGIDTSKDWAKKLIEKAPSFQRLSLLNIDEVDCEESEKKQIKDLVKEWKKTDNNKEAENLKQAKALMRQAEEMALNTSTENKDFNKIVREILKKLELPLDWYKQLDKSSPKNALKIMKSIFEECIEIRPGFDSLEEVAAKANAGRALTCVLYSEYAEPKTAGVPILEPPLKVEPLNPSIPPFQSEFLRFASEKEAAAFFKTVNSTGFDFAVGATGHIGSTCRAGATMKYKRLERKESISQFDTFGTSLTVIHYLRMCTKSFRIDRDDMKLRKEAKEQALLITKEKDTEKQKDAARNFFRRYGSHIPSGEHSLGGIFFSIVTARSIKKTKMVKLDQEATKHFQAELSAGFNAGGMFGGDAFLKFDKKPIGAEKGIALQNESEEVECRLKIKSIGPNASNPAMFKKLLSDNNSTWSILERGPESAYFPVWELFQKLDGKYTKPAKVMEQTWKEDEEKLKAKYAEDDEDEDEDDEEDDDDDDDEEEEEEEDDYYEKWYYSEDDDEDEPYYPFKPRRRRRFKFFKF